MNNENTGRNAAEQFRQQHSLGRSPIPNIARLIEHKLKIGVAYVRSSFEGHGMTMLLDETYLIAVACTEHPMRLRSTLAHELGHLQLGTVNRNSSTVDWSARSPEEIQADAFARHLLVPLAAVSEMTSGKDVTPKILSDIVQTYLASPIMVAIQLRDIGAIDADTCKKWGALTTRTLATQFGWRSEYEALVEESTKPRGPQNLMARAMAGYRQGSITASTIAKLSGEPSAMETKAALTKDNIDLVIPTPDVAAKAPEDTGKRLTEAELAALMGDAK